MPYLNLVFSDVTTVMLTLWTHGDSGSSWSMRLKHRGRQWDYIFRIMSWLLTSGKHWKKKMEGGGVDKGMYCRAGETALLTNQKVLWTGTPHPNHFRFEFCQCFISFFSPTPTHRFMYGNCFFFYFFFYINRQGSLKCLICTFWGKFYKIK